MKRKYSFCLKEKRLVQYIFRGVRNKPILKSDSFQKRSTEIGGEGGVEGLKKNR